jgi:hypothetical protein
MAAIQQIQNLIALSQPIPPDLQIAALLEAQQQGLSSNALAGVFGVPESMIADAVSALGLRWSVISKPWRDVSSCH